MEVILLEDIINLGYKDDVVTVKAGYARNYLIPQKKAVIATESAKKVIAENQRQQAHKLEAIKNAAEELGNKITALGKLTIATKTSSTGKIFGSVSNIQIAEELEKAGIELDRRLISVKGSVKELGEFEATAKLHKEVSVDIPFEVISVNHDEIVKEEKPAKAEKVEEAEKAEETAEAATEENKEEKEG